MTVVENEYRVIGPPGCGKTTYLSTQVTQRVERWCADTGLGPHQCQDVLVSSLTKAAAGEVLSRGLSLPDEQVGTLHAHALHALGNPKLCVGPKQISEWNKQAKMDHWIKGGSVNREEDGFSLDVGQFRGDELMNEYTINRCRMTPRETWRADVVEFADAFEKWKFMNSYMDYTDLIDTAFRQKVAPPGNPSTILVDECFPGWTPVQLADGTSKTIQEIVDGKLPVKVLSYDTDSQKQVSSTVIGWSRTLNQKRLLKVRVKWLRKRGTCTLHNFVICTEDHRLWCDGAWVRADEIKVGGIMQVETSATKSQRGKITSRGRDSLASVMLEKNKIINRTSDRKGCIKKRGGNGSPMPLAQKTVFDKLGSEWSCEHVVRTGRGCRAAGLPTHYKIDIANPSKKIAVEIDGQTHSVIKVAEADARKTEFLRGLGWKVIRFTNREAIQETDRCVSEILNSDCPIGAVVVSVDEISIPDSYVYDITVAGTHCFYANGILAHNCQDHDRLELRLLRYWATKVNKLIIVGDPDQNLYEWRGSDPGGFYESEIPEGHTKVLEQSYRVPRKVHAAAMEMIGRCGDGRKQVVYHPRDEQGEVSFAPYSLRMDPVEAVREIERLLDEPDSKPGQAKVMLLFSCAYMTQPITTALRDAGIPFWNPYSRERSNFNPLHPAKGVSTLDRILRYLKPNQKANGDGAKMWTWSDFHEWSDMCNAEGWLRHGQKAEIKRRAASTPHQEMSVEDIEGVLSSPAILSELEEVDLGFLAPRIADAKLGVYNYVVDIQRKRGYNSLSSNPRVVVGTIHSVKGAEADHVILSPDLSSSGWEVYGSKHIDSLHRLFYVGLTRAYRRLVLCQASSPRAIQW